MQKYSFRHLQCFNFLLDVQSALDALFYLRLTLQARLALERLVRAISKMNVTQGIISAKIQELFSTTSNFGSLETSSGNSKADAYHE